MKKTKIGWGHMIRAMQKHGFGHDEIMAMRNAMINHDFSNIEFCEDVYTEQWAFESEQEQQMQKGAR